MSPSVYLGVVFAAALTLHVHTAFTMWRPAGTMPSTFALGLLIWSLLPYVVCLIAARVTKHIGPSVAAASLILAIDVATYWSTLSSKDGQTGLVFLFMPLWNLIIFVPVTLFIGQVMVRRRLRAPNAP